MQHILNHGDSMDFINMVISFQPLINEMLILQVIFGAPREIIPWDKHPTGLEWWKQKGHASFQYCMLLKIY